MFVTAMLTAICPGLSGIGKSEHDDGQSAFRAVNGQEKAKVPPPTRRLTRRSWQIDFSRPPRPGAGLVALRQIFVRRCHTGRGSPEPANRQMKTRQRRSAFGAVWSAQTVDRLQVGN